jgi:prevent-host-death family protein
MKSMSINEAQAGFTQMLKWVENGEEVEITRHEQPVAKVVPVRKAAAVNLAGSVLEERDVVSPIGARWEAAS